MRIIKIKVKGTELYKSVKERWGPATPSKGLRYSGIISFSNIDMRLEQSL